MPELKDCFTKFVESNPDLHKHLKEKSGVDYQGGEEGRDAYIKAITDLQQETLNSIRGVYEQAGKSQESVGGAPPATPSEPPPTTEGKGESDGGRPKAILNKIHQSTNVIESVKKKFEEHGLKYKPQSHEDARKVAKEVIGEFGAEQSVSMAEAGRFDGDVNSMIFAEAIDQTYLAEQAAASVDEKNRLAEAWADYTIRYDEAARSGGKFISAIYDFYRKSPLGVILSEKAKRDEAFKDWLKKREGRIKEVWEAIKEEPEVKDLIRVKVETQLKQERAVNRMKRRKKIEDTFDKLKIGSKGLNSAIIPPQLWDGAVEVMKQAALAGETIANIIQQGVDHIKNNHTDAWDEDAFRKKVEDQLSGMDAEGKSPLTTEEKQQRILEKFRKKLSGLTEDQKDEVIRKSFKKLVEAGALDYDDFKKIIADTIGLGEMSAEEVTKLTGFVKDMNAVQDLSDALMKDETKENLKAFEAGVKKAEDSATRLAGMLYNNAKPAQRLRSIIQLNTLGLVSLIRNPFYNIFHQMFVRLPKGVVMTILDQAILGASVASNKVFGTPIIKPDTNVFLAQGGYFSKGAKGGAQAVQQVFTGLTNKDYFQKEVYNSQIKPFTSIRDLWGAVKGEKKLTTGQIIDKAIQAFPTGGMAAELVARGLNIGDKPFRYAAEAAVAGTIGRTELGLSGFDLEIFMRLPKEKAKKVYKAKGLTEEQAEKKAEQIEKRIISEGEEAVFQQNNAVADAINKLKQQTQKLEESHPLSSVAGGAAKLFGTLNMPFVKTPVNVAWEVFNLVNPEIAILQSLAYGVRAIKNNSRADFVRSKKWAAHAATGWAILAATGYLASIGAVSGDDEDEPYKEKEAKGKGTYEKSRSINMSKLWRATNGGTIETQDGDVNVDLSWLGAFGVIQNMQANKYENMTQEERESMEYIDGLLYRMNRGAQDGLVNSVFQGSLTAVDAIRSGKYNTWLNGMINVGANAIEPATLAQLSRATRPYDYKITGEDLPETLKNNLKARFFGLGGNPPSKVNIWGQPMRRDTDTGNVALRMLGISRSDTDQFGVPIFNDFKRTGDARFWPPAVSSSITVDGETHKLPPALYTQLETLIGQARQATVAPFVNDKATVRINKIPKRYSQIKDDEEKIAVLKDMYEEGYDNGKEAFLKLHPEFLEK